MKVGAVRELYLAGVIFYLGLAVFVLASTDEFPNAQGIEVVGDFLFRFTDQGWSTSSATNDCAPDYLGRGADQWGLTLTQARDVTISVQDCCCPGE